MDAKPIKIHLGRWVLLLVLIVFITASVGGFATAQEPDINFSNLSDGQTLSGLLTLTGSVNFPDFQKYELFLKSGNDNFWVANSHAPVVNGNLARFDTRVFGDGTYQLFVRQVGSDSNYTDYLGPNITIDNGGGSLPYFPEVEPSFLYTNEARALLRIRNCTGEDFRMDYTSPQDFRSSGETLLPAQIPNYICTFEDHSLIPGEYRGTAKGMGQIDNLPFLFEAHGGMVYEMVYNGPNAGHNALVVQPVPGDSPNAPAVDSSATGSESMQEMAPAMPAAQAQATPAAVLPISGDGQISGSSLVLFVVGLLLVGVLVFAGVRATRRKSPNTMV